MYKGRCNSSAHEFFRGYVDNVLKMKNKKIDAEKEVREKMYD